MLQTGMYFQALADNTVQVYSAAAQSVSWWAITPGVLNYSHCSTIVWNKPALSEVFLIVEGASPQTFGTFELVYGFFNVTPPETAWMPPYNTPGVWSGSSRAMELSTAHTVLLSLVLVMSTMALPW
jgi:hypothetical protein